jgi:hypothetical protein
VQPRWRGLPDSSETAGPDFDFLNQPEAPGGCPESAYSTSDPNLTPITPDGNSYLLDSASDQSANAANTITFTLDLTECFASKGFDVQDGDLQFDFWASPPPGSAYSAGASQIFYFRVE